MNEAFDPYHKWLGITPAEQPPNHYRLLGLRLFEDDLEVVSNASDQRMAHLRTLQTGRHAALSQRLLNEISAATVCLLHSQKKSQYDQALRGQLAAAGSPVSTPAPPCGHRVPSQSTFPVGAVPSDALPIAAVTPVTLVDSPASEIYSIVDETPRSHFNRRARKTSKPWLGPVLIVVILMAGGVLAAVVFNRYQERLAGNGESGAAALNPARQEPVDTVLEPAIGQPSESTHAAENANDADPALAAGRLLERVRSWIATGGIKESKPAGGGGGSPFNDMPPDGGLLVGLKVSRGSYAGHRVVKSIQPIFLTGEGIKYGQVHGQPSNKIVEVRAKEGYAIGGLSVRSGNRVDGMDIIFMRITNHGLDPANVYRSEWIAGQGGGGPTMLGGDGSAVVGIYGGVGAEFDRVGLILAAPKQADAGSN